MNFAEVNNTALRYDLLGSGAATLVLIHEMGGTIESWDLVASTKRRAALRHPRRWIAPVRHCWSSRWHVLQRALGRTRHGTPCADTHAQTEFLDANSCVALQRGPRAKDHCGLEGENPAVAVRQRNFAIC